MRNKVIAAMAAVLGLLAVAPVAQANYFIDKRQAESFTRSEYHARYDAGTRTGVSCRPQGRSAPQRGYIYHRWTCTWVDENDMWGQFLIAGNSRGPDWYHVKLLRGVGPL
jgi:hypothetical protein